MNFRDPYHTQALEEITGINIVLRWWVSLQFEFRWLNKWQQD